MPDRHAIVDPFLFSMPDISTRTAAESYLKRVATWSSEIFANAIEYSIAEAVVGAMIDAGTYPSFEAVQHLIAKYQLESFTAYDINRYLSVIFGSRPYLEERAGGINALVVAAGFKVDPNIFLDRLNGSLCDAFRDSLFTAAAALHRDWQVDVPCCATYHDCPDQEIGISVRGTVEMAESLGELLDGFPINVEQEFCCILEPFTKVENDQIELLWEDPVRATRCAYEKLPVSERSCGLGTIRVSLDFCASLKKLGLHRKPSLLRRIFHLAAMAAIGRIQTINGADVHPVRTKAAADAPQVEREDGSKMWRCKVSQRGAGYRMHYWTLPKSGLELENVTVESEV